jgi:hypothetical protein
LEEIMRKLIVNGSAALLLLLIGCGDDDTSSATTDATETTVTTPAGTGSASADLTPEEAAYCAELAALPDSGDPGFDAFFTEHPEPTLEDWAEFLPGVVDDLRTGLAAFDAVEPPPSLADARQDVHDAMSAVADSFDAALAAAEAGDQAAYDAAEAENQGGLSATMEEAMNALGGVCGLGG